MKTIINTVLFLFLMAFIGCRSNLQEYYKPVSTNTYMSSSFNLEYYIWENFLFPTNRTTGVQ